MTPEFAHEEVKDLSLPQLKTPVGKVLFIKIVGPLHKSEMINKDGKEAATICTVVNLEQPEMGKHVMIPGAVASNELVKAYPGEKYVGKCFKYCKGEKASGSKASPCLLVEIKPSR